MKKIKFTLVVAILSLFIQSCHKGGPWGVRGEGSNVTETRTLDGFDKIHLSIDADVYYTQDSIYKVEISAQQNILAILKSEVKNGTLSFDYRRNMGRHNKVKITVHSPEISELSISGSGDIAVQNSIKATRMECSISGSGNILFPSLSGQTLKATISGSGDLKISGGSMSSETFNISGSGNMDTEYLPCESAVATISGSGDISLNASEDLKATISGHGDIRYKGKPVINSSISGTGRLIHIE